MGYGQSADGVSAGCVFARASVSPVGAASVSADSPAGDDEDASTSGGTSLGCVGGAGSGMGAGSEVTAGCGSTAGSGVGTGWI